MKNLRKNEVEAAKIFVVNYGDTSYDLMRCMVLNPDIENWIKFREPFSSLTSYGYLDNTGNDSYKLGPLGLDELKMFITTGKTKNEVELEKINRKEKLEESREWINSILSGVSIIISIWAFIRTF